MQVSSNMVAATAVTLKPAPMQPLPKADEPLEPVRVSDKPHERMDQLVGFFQRNPGWMKLGPTSDAIRSAMDRVPGVGGLYRDLTEPADVGYGQAIRDQTQWQMDTGRQPNNLWWLRMNRQLVEDPLTAERAVRTGRVSELKTPGERAWAEYIRRADKVYAAVGLTPEEVARRADAGEPVALSDAWKGAGLLKRAYAQMVLKPYARKAIWVAHRKTLEDGRPQAMEQAIEMHRRAPKEMSFSSSWASVIGLWSYLSPSLIGNQSKLAQKLILPLTETIDEAKDLSWSKRAFAKVADWIDPIYERDIVPAAEAADAAKAARG
ncbi:MAG: hypothetical protein KDC46_06065 [Thermoleophilia bacterium]|nr:hypothetical protein [Thermoleophilia bacterium]